GINPIRLVQIPVWHYVPVMPPKVEHDTLGVQCIKLATQTSTGFADAFNYRCCFVALFETTYSWNPCDP
ncbi:hypothetical protein HAX54_019517, partial [Datura stramonium]|nr:hypothetical protein [Datura stramonium]